MLYCHLLLCVFVCMHLCVCVVCVHVCPTEPKRRKVDEKVKIFMKNDITYMYMYIIVAEACMSPANSSYMTLIGMNELHG